jgi:PPM family protein phosphatase
MSSITFHPAGATHIGNVRTSNEDHHLIGGDLFVVADGMGRRGHGRIASRLAADSLRAAFGADPTAAGLVEAVRIANTAVRDRAEADPELAGMGTTIAAVARVDDRLVIVNVGDTRVHLFRDGTLARLSADHSRVADLVRAGEITETEAADHPERHLLTLALGVERTVAPGVNHTHPLPGDRLLLCTDGLFTEVTEDAIVTELAAGRAAGPTSEALVAAARANGGHDNITAVVVDIG